MGEWYLSLAIAKKLDRILITLYPEEGKYKSLVGFEIATMYDFFMVFVVMSAIAALMLFLLSHTLKKLMHGIR